jgi:hypothetical protein
MNQKTVDAILRLAETAFITDELPDKFARYAAHEAAHAMAAKHSRECADVATLLAACSLLIGVTDAVSFSARVADAAKHKMAYDNVYRAARGLNTEPVIPSHTSSETSYRALTQNSHHAVLHSTTSVLELYQAAFAQHATHVSRANHAAYYAYKHTYCVARAAYVISSFKANQFNELNQRKHMFQIMMAKRLHHDLNYDVIKPSFFIQCLCSLILNRTAKLAFVAGVIGLLCALIAPSMLMSTSTVVASGVSALFGAGGMSASFFAHKKKKQIEEANEYLDERTHVV